MDMEDTINVSYHSAGPSVYPGSEVDGIVCARIGHYSKGFFSLKDDVPEIDLLRTVDKDGYYSWPHEFHYRVRHSLESFSMFSGGNCIYTVDFDKVDPYITNLSSPA